MISDWELVACAQQVVKQHGAKAAEHIEKRVTELASAGDEADVSLVPTHMQDKETKRECC